ncbi:MAG TPA: hypothetical protein VFR77_09315 [Steroidobacteraceae bacterium]|nr:hypothetical protein [Steroidobacteraceae bacterium]
MKHLRILAAVVAILAAAHSHSDDGAAPEGHSIAYVATNLSWALQSTPEMRECPRGLNDGVREQFKLLFPESDGTERTFEDTQLRRQVESYHPTVAPDALPFLEGEGPVAPGLDLDGRQGPEDFTSPDGRQGIDNQMHRVLGCIANYRAPDGPIRFFEDEMVLRENYNRIIVQLTGVDSLADDADVGVMIFRGRDKVLVDAGGLKALPGGTQRIDTRWGSRYIRHTRGRIANGVLTTEPVDLLYPWDAFYMPTDQYMWGARLRLALTPESAEGLVAGYTDVETWYMHMLRNWSAHYQSYGKSSGPSIYKAMRRLADGVPDPATGANRAISSALAAKFTQVRVLPFTDTELAAIAAAEPGLPYRGMPAPRPVAEELAETRAGTPAVAGAAVPGTH